MVAVMSERRTAAENPQPAVPPGEQGEPASPALSAPWPSLESVRKGIGPASQWIVGKDKSISTLGTTTLPNKRQRALLYSLLAILL